MILETVEAALIVLIVVMIALLGALVPLYLGIRRHNEDADEEDTARG